MCYPKPGPRCDTDVLTRLIDKLGFQRGRFNDDNMENRVELLVTRGGLQALADSIKDCSNQSKREALLAAYRTGYTNYLSRMSRVDKTPRALKNHPQDWESVDPERDIEKLQKVAVDLYLPKTAPLHDKARNIENKFTATTSGYIPASGTGHISVIRTAEVAEKMKIDPNDLPSGIVAYDIETDTQKGFGLQPHRTQITEMVLTDNGKTTVLSGDEREILQGFADYMNSCSPGTQFVGWNNQGFDNPTLYIRGQHHKDHLYGWGMQLQDSSTQGGYGPVGGYTTNQAMNWVTPDGTEHKDSDVMLSILNSPVYKGGSLRLKQKAQEWGANPIELDRERMHEYTATQREAYVASDGVATLFNYAQFLQKMKDHSKSER